jgi:hypothetical protein
MKTGRVFFWPLLDQKKKGIKKADRGGIATALLEPPLSSVAVPASPRDSCAIGKSAGKRLKFTVGPAGEVLASA